MNVQEIKMHAWDARRAMKEYSASVKRLRAQRLADAETDLARSRLRKTSIELEDEALRRAYRALALEKRVLNINTVMRAGGLDAKTKLPKLAIIRADCKRVSIWANNTQIEFHSNQEGFSADKNTKIPTSVLGYELSNSNWRNVNHFPTTGSVSALTPQIPPRYRPEPEKLKEHYLLFEPNWEVKPPDPDPFLLSPLGGAFFVIVAQWDMTPLEQSILETRLV